MDGWFEAVEHVDHAQAAIDRWRSDHADGKSVEPGTRVTVVNTRSASGERPLH